MEGERHLGAVIGSIKFREQYVTNKVTGWIKDVQDLADIGKEEPQLAYAAFTKGLAHRSRTFVQPTIKDIGHLFEPLEESIRNSFIPSVVGR